MKTDKDPATDFDPLLGDEQERSDGSRAGFVPEFMRKVAVAGLGALFMTEEGLRAMAGQLKLPKEVLGYILGQAEKTKDEVGRVVSEELRRFLQSEKLRDEALKFLSGMTVEVKAQIRLVPAEADEKKGEPLRTDVAISELRTRRGGKKSASKKE
ncbi:hypothetical protein [Melittangium boletus]|uniref:Uncharacterized protein n=1 Tax=Melittangium boletus DSM 14713 TaxID=1294270 RepID=A0A250IPP9_9BACT|nr:hypothetical protein [Melittangium boletus]ATB33724.1 hypothetical protein MEBOL_007222 [Melittangium boletus DSM 14713]